MCEFLSISAVLTALVDGAANMMHQANNGYVPTFVSGDFDSASPEVLEYYREKVSGTFMPRDLLDNCRLDLSYF